MLSHLHAPVILGGRSYCLYFTEKKQTQLGFALGPLGVIDGTRTDSRACVLIVHDEFLKLWADKGETLLSPQDPQRLSTNKLLVQLSFHP